MVSLTIFLNFYFSWMKTTASAICQVSIPVLAFVLMYYEMSSPIPQHLLFWGAVIASISLSNFYKWTNLRTRTIASTVLLVTIFGIICVNLAFQIPSPFIIEVLFYIISILAPTLILRTYSDYTIHDFCSFYQIVSTNQPDLEIGEAEATTIMDFSQLKICFMIANTSFFLVTIAVCTLVCLQPPVIVNKIVQLVGSIIGESLFSSYYFWFGQLFEKTACTIATVIFCLTMVGFFVFHVLSVMSPLGAELLFYFAGIMASTLISRTYQDFVN